MDGVNIFDLLRIRIQIRIRIRIQNINPSPVLMPTTPSCRHCIFANDIQIIKLSWFDQYVCNRRSGQT
jgi:hypothetical protein